MQGSVLTHDLRKVISLVDLLRDIGLDKLLSLPKVVVLGNQSSGKSSLLQQIVGLDFLPRGSGVVTRRPLQLRMNNVPELNQPYAEFDQVVEGGKKKKFTNFNEVRKTIDEVTDKVCGKAKIIVDNPIVLNVFSPNCPNLTLVDLPGITAIPVGDQPKNIYDITRDMALRYIKQPRSIILCVIPANQDLATSEALKIMRQIDPSGERSIGCLTKIDIMNRGDDARNVLKNQQIPLRYGYVGIKNRCQQDVINNVPVTQSLKTEKKFFTTSPIYSTLPPGTFGTQALTHKLTTILYQQIKASMPQIFEQIKKKKQQAQQQLDKLGPGIASTDAQMVNYAWKSISSFLRIYLNSINGIKNVDYQNDPISSEIRQQLFNLYKEQYDEPATEDLSDKDIQRAMINFPGDSTIPGFPSIDAFLALLNPLLKKLQNPAYKINNKIHQLMETQAIQIVDKIMTKKFPEFNARFSDLVKRVLEKHRRDLQSYLNSLLDAQLSYLYTNDISYLMNDFGLTNQQKKKLQSGKIRDPLIFELRKRIDSYFKLVVRNLRDLVPKQIFSFLMTKCLKQLEFEAFQFTSDINKLKEWLNEPAEVRNKRNECVKAIKVFEESQKKIRMDPEISKLVKNSQRQSKYYKKFGMKTPEQLERQQLQKQKAAYKSKADEAFKRKPDGKGDFGGDKGTSIPKPEVAPNVVRKVEPVVVQQQKKTTGFLNMFGESAPKKQPQVVRQAPTQPIQNKDPSINALFGPGPSQKPDLQPTKSPVIQKKQMNFDFESAWKAEQATKQTPPVPRVQPIVSPNQPKNPMMTNVQKPPEPQRIQVPQPMNQPPKDVQKKKATFNNLFGLK